MWCDGVGARFKAVDGNWVNKNCSHCIGPGRSRYTMIIYLLYKRCYDGKGASV